MEVFLIVVATLVAGVGSVLIAGLLSVNFLSRFGDYFLSFAGGAVIDSFFESFARVLSSTESPFSINVYSITRYYFLLFDE